MALVITDAGRAASVRAGDLGVEFKISHISIGTEGYSPTVDQTELRAEIIRKPVVRGRIIKLGHLHFEADFDGKEEFEGKEVGYHLDDDSQTLFGVDSDDGKVLTLKKANSIVTEVIDLNLSASRMDNITVEVATTPYANEETPGIAEVATDEEITAGMDDERIVTPKKLATHLKPNFIIAAEHELKHSTINVIATHKAFTLSDGDDYHFIARVDSSVDFDAGDVSFTAPDGEKIKVLETGEKHETVRIVLPNVEYRFMRINGELQV